MHRSHSRVVLVPDWAKGNPYLERLTRALTQEGFDLSTVDCPKGFFKLTRLAIRHPSAGILHIQWLHPLVGIFFWSKNLFRYYIGFWLFALDLFICRALGVRIVWTVHNLVEHECPAVEEELKVRAYLARAADIVIVHSEEALEAVESAYSLNLGEKARVIPHGNYLGIYQTNDRGTDFLKKRYHLKGEETVVLFFGSIRKYKGVDTLISAFRSLNDSNYRLILAGKPLDEGTALWVEAMARNDDRILLCLDFVPESEVAAHFALADAVALPFARTLTSGSAILAMGFGKCLILPDRARVLGLPGEAGALYYKGESELKNVLARLGDIDLVGKGRHNLDVAKSLDWSEVGMVTGNVYRQLARA